MEKNIEVEESGIKCDNPDCNWRDDTVTFETMEAWIDRPCPKCGENLLTEHDYNLAKSMMDKVAILNSMSAEEMREFTKQTLGITDEELNEMESELSDVTGIAVETHKEVKITLITDEPKPEEPI